MMALTLAQVTPLGWTAIIGGAITTLGGVAVAVVKLREVIARADDRTARARVPVEVAEVNRQAKRDEDESLRFKTGFALAERFIGDVEEHLERERLAHDRTRERLESTSQENGRLQEENGQLRFEKLALTERVDRLETNVRDLQEEVRVCHENRASDMRDVALWVTGELSRVGIRPSVPAPQPRSLTPRDFPAVTSTDGAKKNV